jgi:FecR protein
MRWIQLALLLAALGLAAGEARAQEPAAGRFVTVIGDVQVLSKDGSGRRLAARSGEIWAGESIVTGRDSLAQLRMSDGGALSVRSATQIKLDAYRYSGHKDPGDNFLVSILRGGFRTITGLIARNYRENYRVQTSAMTIGVRGTDFEVVHVLNPAADVRPGTYNRVYAGITTMQNRTGATILVHRDQTAFVPLAGNLAPALVLPPAGIFGKPTPPPPAPDDAPQGDGGRGDGSKGDRGKGDAGKGDAGKGDGGRGDSSMGDGGRGDGGKGDGGKGDGGKGEARTSRSLPAVLEKPQGVAPAAAPAKSMAAPLLNPIDSPRVLDTAPALQTAPSTTLQMAPTTSPLIAPTVKSIETAPTTTISPVLTAPTTATNSPVLTAPVTTTISPVLTSPATTTISPVLTAPVTTTISPTLTAPTTTIIIKR